MFDFIELSNKIIGGYRLKKEDDLSFFIDGDLESLKVGADNIRKHFSGEKVDLCSIISGRKGKCSENCKFCAQSAHYNTGCQEYDFLQEEIIVKECKYNVSKQVDRFAIVTSGKSLKGEEFEKAIKTYERMNKECDIDLCASMGFLTYEQFLRLKEAGVKRYHDNIETAPSYFSNVCTSHTLDGKIETIKNAKRAGLGICSGGIIGMGESFEQRIEMALTLADIKVDSIPINILMPIKGTPFENLKPLEEDEIIRTIAMFRFINPEADIRLAGGRILMKDSGREGFLAGASATITGDMLTTTNATIDSDKKMLAEMGRL